MRHLTCYLSVRRLACFSCHEKYQVDQVRERYHNVLKWQRRSLHAETRERLTAVLTPMHYSLQRISAGTVSSSPWWQCVGSCRVSNDRRRLRAGKLRPAGRRRRVAVGRRQRGRVRRQLGVRDAVWPRCRRHACQPAHLVTTHSRSAPITFNFIHLCRWQSKHTNVLVHTF